MRHSPDKHRGRTPPTLPETHTKGGRLSNKRLSKAHAGPGPPVVFTGGVSFTPTSQQERPGRAQINFPIVISYLANRQP